MKTPYRLLAILTMTLSACAAMGQTVEKNNCASNGFQAPEPLGTDGRALSVSRASCFTEGGPLSGGVTSQNAIWEFDKGKMQLLSGDGVVRKAGSLLAYKLTSGVITLLMQDGKPAGWTGSGTGIYTVGSGAAASMTGKTFKWTGKATGPGTHLIESTPD